MTRYVLVGANGYTAFQKRVNEMLDNGYILTINPVTSTTCYKYIQAMVLPERPRKVL